MRGRAGGDSAAVTTPTPREGCGRVLLRRPAAVHRDMRAGDRLRGVAAEEDGERAEVLGGGEFEHRLLFLEHILARDLLGDALLRRLVVDLLLNQRGENPARADRIACDP